MLNNFLLKIKFPPQKYTFEWIDGYVYQTYITACLFYLNSLLTTLNRTHFICSIFLITLTEAKGQNESFSLYYKSYWSLNPLGCLPKSVTECKKCLSTAIREFNVAEVSLSRLLYYWQNHQFDWFSNFEESVGRVQPIRAHDKGE